MRRPPIALEVVAGLLLGFFVLSAPAAVGVAALLAAGLLLVRAGRRPTPPSPPAHAGAASSSPPRARVFALALGLGLVAAARADLAPTSDLLAAGVPEHGLVTVVEGEVLDADPPSPMGLAFVVEVHAFHTGEGRVVPRRRPRLRAQGGGFGSGTPLPPLHPGDEVVVGGTVRRLPAPTNPGAFDARDLWGRRGVFARLDVPDGACVERHVPARGLLADVSRWRHAICRRLSVALSRDDAGLLRSLVVGDRGALESSDRLRFLRAGAAHILAISGSHVALLVAGLLVALRRLRVPRRPAAWLVLAAVLLLVPLTGSAPPVIRSAAGFSLFLLGRLLGREPRGALLLALVVTGYLALDPMAARDVGFRLSFAAAAGLVLLAGRLRSALVPFDPVAGALGRPRPRAPLRSALAAGAAAFAASSPVTIHDLGQAGWVAIPVGLVAVPLSTLAIVAGLLVALCGDTPGLASLTTGAARALLFLLRACLDVPPAVGALQAPVVPPPALWYAAYGLAFLAAVRAPPRLALGGGAAMALLLGAVPFDRVVAPPAHVRLTFLDVGHGQACLLEAPDGARALLDAGSRDRPGVADRTVLPALHALGVPALDVVVASHADADHAGALPAVADAMPVRLAVVPEGFDPSVRAPIEARVGALLEAADGDVVLSGAWGRVVVLGPARANRAPRSENDGGLVLRVETPHGRALLPGDREALGVDDLLAAHDDVGAEVLVLPHHGLPGPGRERLRAAVGARVEVASAARAVAATLPDSVLVTGRDGALAVTLAPGGPVVTRLRPPGPWVPPYHRGAGAMPDLPTLAIAVVLLAAIVAASVRLGWLRTDAALAAGVLGFLGVLAFSWAGLAALLAPFLVATLLGKAPGGLESGGPRVLAQVLANGAPGLVGLGVALLGGEGVRGLGAAAFAGAFAALGADTVATEVGTRFGGTPRHALTWRPLARGESGGVSLAGLAGSVGGGALAPVAMALCGGLSWAVVGAVTAAGVAAGYVDSVVGAVFQRKGTCAACGREVETRVCCGAPVPTRARRLAWLDNDGVNVVCGLVGALLSLLAAHLLRDGA